MLNSSDPDFLRDRDLFWIQMKPFITCLLPVPVLISIGSVVDPKLLKIRIQLLKCFWIRIDRQQCLRLKVGSGTGFFPVEWTGAADTDSKYGTVFFMESFFMLHAREKQYYRYRYGRHQFFIYINITVLFNFEIMVHKAAFSS
jgi:hypothetical protein